MSRRPRPAPIRRASDRITVALFSLAAFLLVLALLGTQLSQAGSSHAAARRRVLVRRIYETTVVERVLPAGVGRGGRDIGHPVGLGLELGLAATGARHTHVMSDPRLTSHTS